MRTLTYLFLSCGHGLLAESLPGVAATKTSSLVRRITFTDLPTLAPQSWCSEVLEQGGVIWHSKPDSTCTYRTLSGPATNEDGTWVAIKGTTVAQGEHSFSATTGASPSPSSSDQSGSKVTGSGYTCPVGLKKTITDGKSNWVNDPGTDSLAMCEQYCEPWQDPNKISSSTCVKVGDDYYDDEGRHISDDLPDVPKCSDLCLCNDPLLDKIVDEVITKALPAIGEIACKTWFTAIDTVVQVGVSAIPGLGATGATLVNFAAQAAQTIAWAIVDEAKAKERYQQWLEDPDNKNAAQATSRSLIDAVCGNKYTPPDAEKVFNAFQFAADFGSAPKLFSGAAKSWPPPFAKGKGSPKEVDEFINSLNPRNSAPKEKPAKSEGLKPTGQQASTHRSQQSIQSPAADQSTNSHTTVKPTNTRISEPPTSQKSSQCARDRRRGNGAQAGNKDCDPEHTTFYRIKNLKPGKTTTSLTTCSSQATQACAHYYSAIHQADRSGHLTYSMSHNVNGRDEPRAVNSWKSDHTDKTWQQFTTDLYQYEGEVTKRKPKCQVDEWPPNYFLNQEQLDKGTKDPNGQLVRWLPARPNGKAGQEWTRFCVKNDGDAGNGLRKPAPSKEVQRKNDPKSVLSTTDRVHQPTNLLTP